jgi:hypothetical protein
MVTPSRAAVLALLCAADLLVMLDGMVVTVALPAIERGLGTARSRRGSRFCRSRSRRPPAG